MSPLFAYSGSGKLTTDRGIIDNCDFLVETLQDGDIQLHCKQSNPLAFAGDTEGFSSFEGVTNDRSKVFVTGEFIRANISSTFGNEANSSATYTASGQSIVTVQYTDNDIVEIRFGVNNFEFAGEYGEEITTSSNVIRTLNHLKLQFEGINIVIRKPNDYDERLKEMKASKNTNVTCEFIYRVSVDKLEQITQITDTICNLLSIAKGKRINWIYLATKDIDGQLVSIEHHHRITSDFTGFELIDKNPPELIVYYLNKCYETYKSLDSTFHFLNIANTVMDIRSRGFLETRCLVIFSLMEYLVRKASFTSKKDTFKSKIEKTILKYRVPISCSEISDFIKSRNSLVHEMQFLTANPLAEYQASLHLLDKLILRILDYDSWYINMEDMSKWTGEQKHKLTPSP